MEDYNIDVIINDVIKEYHVIPKFTAEVDNQYEVFCEEVFICIIWFEYDINGIVWFTDDGRIRQEVVDQLGEGIEMRDI